ncbi:Gamma-glutamyl cyclotransferase, AIG2-like [Limimonas halophila]|uniref:Putative gamma-glutamylcyclotransferase n=1 Tax=Limimonas halophila TaxID=1082479 RepID=A0A1G7SZ51_9PROT|nr:gamma-glutamylcyclotransferase family protein [Limimonas halophila]SDG28343.1 Gamma-glutamyl cyclotransferase, AIG2-like [Limimonas halophila]
MLFFVYGTLMDPDLRRTVFGRRAGEVRVTPGVLLNHVRRTAAGGPFPVVLPRPGGRVPGYFLENLDRELLLWMAHFEGPGYLPRRVTAWDARGGRLRPWTFAPVETPAVRAEGWDMRRWQAVHKPAVQREAKTWMLATRPGHPLALDVSWLGRRRLRDVVAGGDDQPQPNPDMPPSAEDAFTLAA